MTISGSWFDDNRARVACGLVTRGPQSTLRISDSRFSKHTLIMINSTVADNTASLTPFTQNRRGGLWSSDAATTILVNAIVARNTAGPFNADCGGPVTSVGHNLIGTLDGWGIVRRPSDLTGDPGLGPFTDNGVPGNGHFPLLPTSQAVDAGDDAVRPRTDQLGEKRKGACDIGAIGFRDKKHPRRENDVAQPREHESAMTRTAGPDIVEDLIRDVTAMKSPTIRKMRVRAN